MTGYSVPSAIHGEMNLEGFGSVAFKFDAGIVTPADDAEAVVLDLLAQNGLVEIAAEKKSKSTKTDPSSEKE